MLERGTIVKKAMTERQRIPKAEKPTHLKSRNLAH
jgi:hypothetical protein